jgi:hypothetical protein
LADDFAAFAKKLDNLEKELDGAGKQRMLETLGKGGKTDAYAAVAGDLGDHSMSHWRRGRPIDINARYDVKGDTVEITPTPRSSGPWRVLEDGRQGGGSHDLVLVGRVRKDGTRRARSRGRSSGATRGKGTWSDAEERIGRETPKRAEQEFVKSLKKVL